MTDKWYKITDRFSIGFAWGLPGWGGKIGEAGFVGLPFSATCYWTPRRRHYKVFVHILFLRVVLAWHRRKTEKKVTNESLLS